MQVIKSNGQPQDFDVTKIQGHAEWACKDLDVSQSEFESSLSLQFYDGMPTSEIAKAMKMTATSMISLKQPDYDWVASRLTIQSIYKAVTGGDIKYPALNTYLSKGVFFQQLDKRLVDGRFDVAALEAAIAPDRDFKFAYLGIQTLQDRYLLCEPMTAGKEKKVYELPQHFLMRVAMGLAILEANPTERAIEFYDVMSQHEYFPSTPTLFNAGTNHPQMSSCYVGYVPDDLKGIFDYGITQNALLSKFAGGIGSDWTPVRSNGSIIKSTNGVSNGVVPFLKIYNQTAVAVNQGGKRKGSFAPYLEVWHGDIFDFADLRLQTGEDNLRTHDIHPAAWIPDLFMERKEAGLDWSLFSPSDVPHLHDLYGAEFKVAYEKAEAEGLACRVVPAMELWKYLLDKLVRTGNPWLTFKDRCNERNPQAHCGVIHNSNLCCMTSDQRVVTDKGIQTVAALYVSQEAPKVAGRGVVSQAGPMLLPRPDAPIVRIVTKEGYEHKVTPDHRVWVSDKGWVEAQHLVAGDLLEIQHTSMFGENSEPNLAFVAGLIAADGTFSHEGKNVRIDLWKDKTDAFVPDVEGMLSHLESQPKFSETAKKFSLNSRELARTLADKGFTQETKLTVPEFVWSGDKKTVSGYLAGVYACDGTVQGTEKSVTVMSLSSVSERFLKDIQILWANFGVKSSVTKMREAGVRSIKGVEYECQAMYRLHITGVQSCKIADDVVVLGDLRDNKQFLKNLKGNGYAQKMTAEFVKLETMPNEDAYCLTVDSEDHAWTVNGLITHNTEITLNNSVDEVAVCNLGSIVLNNHIRNGRIDSDKLQRTVKTAVRMLDNVIDINYYPVPEARNSNLKHRPVGLGVMGYAEALVMSGINWESQDHLQWADELFEEISYYSIGASADLAIERGAYPSFKGSTWSKGQLTIDTFKGDKKMNVFSPMEWQLMREKVMATGIRNSNITAVAPTATIANIIGTTECIQLPNERIVTKENLSGNFELVNPIMKHGRPDLVKTVWEVDQMWSIKANCVRQKWIDQSQSLNLYRRAEHTGRVLDMWYTELWRRGGKTSYYLRNHKADKSVAASAPELNMITAPINLPVQTAGYVEHGQNTGPSSFDQAVEGNTEAPFECEACQ